MLLTYPDSDVINEITAQVMQERPEYEFSSLNRDVHYMWIVSDPEKTEKIRQEFEHLKRFTSPMVITAVLLPGCWPKSPGREILIIQGKSRIISF